MKTHHLVLLLSFNVLWAATLSVYRALDPYPYLTPGGIVTLRFGLAAVCLLALWPWLPGRAPRGRDLLVTALMGAVVFMLGHRLQVLGVKLGSAGNSSVLMAVEPLITSVAAAVFLREHVPGRRWAGFSLGLGGVLLLNGFWRADFQWTGLAASFVFILSLFSEAAYSILGKPMLARCGALKVVALSLASGALANLLIDGGTTLEAARQMPLRAWLLIGYLAVLCTAVGYSLWYVVIREADVNLAAMTIFAQPVAGVALAALWLGEKLHWGQFWGSAAIVLGLIVGLGRGGPRLERAQPGGAVEG